MEHPIDKPNGPVAAALLAGGIGCAALGLLTFFNQVFPTSPFSKTLNWVKSVGTLSGKTNLAIIAFALSWFILHLAWRRRQVRFGPISIVAFVLLAVGLIGTFPPVWSLFLPPILVP